MKYIIQNLSQYGIIDDIPSTELPENAFTSGSNVRFNDGKVIKCKGWQRVFGVPISAPSRLILTSYAPTVTVS